ncbi:MAG: peptidoglycan DD-metalloendopeptidase family protein, partial [Fibrobacterota bacterium]
PGSQPFSSYLLFKKRFFLKNHIEQSALRKTACRFKNILHSGRSDKGPEIPDITVNVSPGLDIIPANSQLFSGISLIKMENLIYNLQAARSYYKYIIVDTPSVWNTLVKKIFLTSSLNVIPVTLNALSTRSLKDYLVEINKLASRHPEINVRILKNEVYGNSSSKPMGKARTMQENREFLEKLCSNSGLTPSGKESILNSSLIFNLEIPESAIIRNSQDRGISAADLPSYSQVKTAFRKLAEEVQFCLNHLCKTGTQNKGYFFSDSAVGFLKKASVAAAAAVWFFSPGELTVREAPEPVSVSQLEKTDIPLIIHKFEKGESVYRFAKHAICIYRAIVPSTRQIDEYLIETIRINNMSLENPIRDINNIEVGTTLTFYPPSQIRNHKYDKFSPAYRYFMGLVNDDYPYITGVWGHYGTGGKSPHQGIDVACAYDSEIITPISGTAYCENSLRGGKIISIVKDDFCLLFAHCNKRFFRSGQKVEAGDTIATVGLTGRTSGPHVHIGYGIKRPGSSPNSRSFMYTDPVAFFHRQFFEEQGEENLKYYSSINNF